MKRDRVYTLNVESEIVNIFAESFEDAKQICERNYIEHGFPIPEDKDYTVIDYTNIVLFLLKYPAHNILNYEDIEKEYLDK